MKTSFHWGEAKNQPSRQFMMRFDVEEMVKEWLVSGRKRGDFSVTVSQLYKVIWALFSSRASEKDGSTFTVPITLIALHHGELALPKVAVTPLPLVGERMMGSVALPNTDTYQVHGAEKVLVLPRGGRSTFVVGMGGDTVS